MLEFITGIVKNIVVETYNTKRFFIEIPSIDKFDFKPGQFVTLDLPIHEKKNKRWRSYSIASCPNNTNVFELIIVLVEGGLGSTYLFNEIQVGSELLVRGPQGVFTLHEPIENDIYMICTGTGIAPFRSMVHYLSTHHIARKNIFLLFGTRTQQDLLYATELNELSKTMNNFYYIPVLSREAWSGKTGYVHQVYKELCNNNPNAEFMLCGWKNMIDEAKKTLQEMGYDKKQIHFELYG